MACREGNAATERTKLRLFAHLKTIDCHRQSMLASSDSAGRLSSLFVGGPSTPADACYAEINLSTDCMLNLNPESTIYVLSSSSDGTTAASIICRPTCSDMCLNAHDAFTAASAPFPWSKIEISSMILKLTQAQASIWMPPFVAIPHWNIWPCSDLHHIHQLFVIASK